MPHQRTMGEWFREQPAAERKKIVRWGLDHFNELERLKVEKGLQKKAKRYTPAQIRAKLEDATIPFSVREPSDNEYVPRPSPKKLSNPDFYG